MSTSDIVADALIARSTARRQAKAADFHNMCVLWGVLVCCITALFVAAHYTPVWEYRDCVQCTHSTYGAHATNCCFVAMTEEQKDDFARHRHVGTQRDTTILSLRRFPAFTSAGEIPGQSVTQRDTTILETVTREFTVLASVTKFLTANTTSRLVAPELTTPTTIDVNTGYMSYVLGASIGASAATLLAVVAAFTVPESTTGMLENVIFYGFDMLYYLRQTLHMMNPFSRINHAS
jgi:hypothetical protein